MLNHGLYHQYNAGSEKVNPLISLYPDFRYRRNVRTISEVFPFPGCTVREPYGVFGWKLNRQPYVGTAFEVLNIMALRHMDEKPGFLLNGKNIGALRLKGGSRNIIGTGIAHIGPRSQKVPGPEALCRIRLPSGKA